MNIKILAVVRNAARVEANIFMISYHINKDKYFFMVCFKK